MKKWAASDAKRLNVQLAGVTLATPIGVGPIGAPCIKAEQLTPDLYAEIFLKHVAAGAGFICLPSTAHVPDALLADLERRAGPPSRPSTSRRPILFVRGEGRGSFRTLPPSGATAQHAAGVFRRTTAKLIEKLKEQAPADIPLIANVSGLGFFPETFVAGAKAHEEAGVDLIELNLSSPASAQATLDDSVAAYFEGHFPLRPPGLFLGDQPDLVEKVTREVVQAVSIPVGVKISAETGFPRVIELARRIRDAGARFITCSNMALTVPAPDIYRKGRSKWPRLDGNPFAAIAGEWLRPLTYKQVASVARFVPGIDIIAGGGISKPEHVVEAMMLGAKAVAMVTPVLYHGRKSLTRGVRFLERYMAEQGYATVEDFTGLALSHIKAANDLGSTYDEKNFVAEVDSDKCKGCGVCSDSICLAMSLEGRTATVNADRCIACGLCVAVCPHDAVRLIASP